VGKMWRCSLGRVLGWGALVMMRVLVLHRRCGVRTLLRDCEDSAFKLWSISDELRS
jgi:hypothetical protein